MGVFGLGLGSVAKNTPRKMECLHVNCVFNKIIPYSGTSITYKANIKAELNFNIDISYWYIKHYEKISLLDFPEHFALSLHRLLIDI